MSRRGTRAGFALILTVALLALLVLAVYALSVLVRVDSQIVATSSLQMRARQNALLGLQVALGELQRTAGRDDSVTAQSSIKQTTFPNQRLTGVWLNSRVGSEPDMWLVSGNHYPEPSTIRADTVITSNDSAFVALVANAVTAASDRIMAKKIPMSSGVVETGNYAFWIGDEGCKASVYGAEATAPHTPSLAPIRPNVSAALANFSVGAAANARLFAYDQIPLIAKDSNLKANFHHLTVASWSYPAGGSDAKAGIFNINTRSERAWRAVLQAYNDLPIASDKRIPESLLAKIAGRIWGIASGRATPGKASRGPFTSVASFRASGVLTEALEEENATITGDEILDEIGAALAVRSDTFRIRAYGDAVNPVDGRVEAVAYCEAIVQRTPETIDATFGRRFAIVYFRWLGPGDI